MSENEKKNASVVGEPEIPVEALKKSYLERVLYTYLKNYFSQGYRRLIERQNAFYFYYCMVIFVSMIGSSVILSMMISDVINLGANKETIVPIMTKLVQLLIYWGLTTAAAYILGGLVGGCLKNRRILNVITIVLMVGALVLTIIQSGFLPISLPLNYNNQFLQGIKIFYFLIFACISSLSMFSIVWMFHTSFTYRFVSLGNSPNRMFMQGILRLGAWVSIPLNIYLLLQNSLDAKILGVFGILISLALVIHLYAHPHIEKNDDIHLKDKKTVRITFNQILGFFNLYLLYRISQSFQTGGKISNLTMDLILLTFNTFYMINVLTKKVDALNELKDERRVFLFQRDTGFMLWVKRSFDEKGLLLFMLGLALGYHSVYMDSYLVGSEINFFTFIGGSWLNDSWSAPPLNVMYHRTYVFLAYIVIMILMISFSLSERIQRLALNRYTLHQVFEMFKDIFRVSEDGTTGVVLETVELGKQKITEQVEKVKTQMKKGLRRFFSLGGSTDDKSE